MKNPSVHLERAQLYESIADALADPPASNWFFSTLCDLKTNRPPMELATAHAALERAFELASHDSPVLEHRTFVRCQLAERGGRREMIEKILAMLRLAQLAEESAQADNTADLHDLEDQQAELLHTSKGRSLVELADMLERSKWAPVHSAIGTALRELIEHDLRMPAA